MTVAVCRAFPDTIRTVAGETWLFPCAMLLYCPVTPLGRSMPEAGVVAREEPGTQQGEHRHTTPVAVGMLDKERDGYRRID